MLSQRLKFFLKWQNLAKFGHTGLILIPLITRWIVFNIYLL